MTRITQSMIYARALRDVQASLRDSVRLQQQVASGRRVNRPSDDPAAMLRILPLRADLRRLGQFADNAQLARETIDLGAAALEDASAVMQSAREVLVQVNNGTQSLNDLHSLGERVDQYLQQLLGLANTNRAGSYLFGGTATDAAPFRLAIQGRSTRVQYVGNGETVSIGVAPGVDTQLNSPGDAIFLRHARGATTLRGGNTGARALGAGDNGVGFDELRATFAGLSGAPAQITAGTGTSDALGPLSYSVSAGALSIGGGPSLPIPATNQPFRTADGRTIHLTVSGPPTPANGTFTALADLSLDGGATTTRVDFTAATAQVRDGDDGAVLNLDVSALTRAGTETVTYTGTFDSFTLLIELRDTLRAADENNIEDTRARLRTLLGAVDIAHDGVLEGLSTYGGRSEQMTALGRRLDNLDLAARESLSTTEDADLTESILQMNKQQLVYQASLQVSARIVQTSLLDFLR